MRRGPSEPTAATEIGCQLIGQRAAVCFLPPPITAAGPPALLQVRQQMAPKKEDKLAGRRVLAPASLWPDFPLPKGQKGWSGEAPLGRGRAARAARE